MTIREALAASSRGVAEGMFQGINPVHVSRQDDGSYEVSIYQMEGQWREHLCKTLDELEAYINGANTAQEADDKGQPTTVTWATNRWKPA